MRDELQDERGSKLFDLSMMAVDSELLIVWLSKDWDLSGLPSRRPGVEARAPENKALSLSERKTKLLV